MKYYLGCSGWYYEHWKNKFYHGLEKKDWFKFYVKNFNSVEINSTFYHVPKQSTVKSWAYKAPDNFKYSVKVNRLITHYKKFNKTKSVLKEFYQLLKILGDKLGCVLFQLPPSIKFDKILLKKILNQLDFSFKNVIEFRHKSWWNNEVYDILKENNTTFCSVSAPSLPSDIIKTSNEIYYRFHGKQWYNYDYSEKELTKFAKSIKKSTKTVWVYFNNDYNSFAPYNCLTLKRIFEKKWPVKSL